MTNRCRTDQGGGRVEHLAQGLGTEIVHEHENEAQPRNGERRRDPKLRLFVADENTANHEREEGRRSSKDEVRCHRRGLWGADLGWMLSKRCTVAVRAVGVRLVPGLRAGCGENPVVWVVGGHQRALLEEPIVHGVTALLLLCLKVLGRHRFFAHLVKSGRHASRGSHGQDDETDNGHGQTDRVAHGCNHAEASDGEANHPEKPSSEGVGQGQFEAAADEVDALLRHGDANSRRIITLIETQVKTLSTFENA